MAGFRRKRPFDRVGKCKNGTQWGFCWPEGRHGQAALGRHGPKGFCLTER